jgi:hypothetical protein
VSSRSLLTNQPREAQSLPREIEFTARLGAPLALGELGWMSTYIVDALMIGRLPHSALSISASSLGNTIFYAIVFCAIRLMTGIDTLVAQSYGAGNHRDCETHSAARSRPSAPVPTSPSSGMRACALRPPAISEPVSRCSLPCKRESHS